MSNYFSLFRISVFFITFAWFTNVFAFSNEQRFVATGESSCGDDICMLVLTSTNAENWVPVSLNFGARDVVKGKVKYLAAGWCRPPLISTDGLNWTEVSLGGDCWNRVSSTNGLFFISGGIGDTDDFASLYSSKDGENFTLVYIKAEAPKFSNVVFGNGRYIAVSSSPDGNLLSFDGKTWESLRPFPIGALVFDGTHFVTINKEGTVGRSQNGLTWKTSHVDASINYLIWDKSKHLYVAVGDKGKILTSTDAIHWTLQHSGTTNQLNKVTKTYGLYLAVGANGTILTSKDTITWQIQNSNTTYNLLGIA